MTIDEMQKIEDENKEKARLHKLWLEEKDWFALVDAKKFYNDKDVPAKNMIIRLSELGENLLEQDRTEFSFIEKIIYRTNKWSEGLIEIDY